MSRWRRPLTAREVRRILKRLGFRHRNTEGGHEQWVKDDSPHFRKVTLSAHTEPFANRLVEYMARQAGVSVRQFYEALDE